MKKIANISIFSLIALLFLAIYIVPSFADPGGASDVCPSGSGWVKYDSWADSKKNQSHDAGSGNIVSQVCVKGSTTVEYFTTNATKSCWNVTGIGSQTSTVSETWSSDSDKGSCKDISHASFYVIAAGVTPTGVTPTGVTPTGVTPTGVTPTGVTPTGVTPTGVTPTGVTPTSVTPTTPIGGEEDPTSTPTPTLTTTPTDAPTATPTPSTSSGPTATATPTASNAATPPVGGVSTIDDPYKGVLGGSTSMAKTGVFEQTAANAAGILGLLSIAGGFLSRRKDRSA